MMCNRLGTRMWSGGVEQLPRTLDRSRHCKWTGQPRAAAPAGIEGRGVAGRALALQRGRARVLLAARGNLFEDGGRRREGD